MAKRREFLGYPVVQWWALGLVVVAVAIAVVLVPERAPRPADHTAKALSVCQSAIRQAATNPSAAKVPFAKNHGTGGEYYFAWPTGAGLRLQNGFGAMIDASAACVVSTDGETIAHLSIDGETII